MVMEREIESTLYAEISKADGFYWSVLCFIDWPGDPVYVHSGSGSISWDSQTWAGVAGIGSIDLPPEMGGLANSEGTFRITGMPDTLADYINDDTRDIDVKVWIGATTEAGGSTLIGDPIHFFYGLCDGKTQTLENTDYGRSRAITLTTRSGPSQRLVGGTSHTNEAHQAKYPGDTFFRHAVGSVQAYRRGIAA